MIIVTKAVKKNGQIPVENKAFEAINLSKQSKFIIEFFLEDELMFCLMEHELVPKHILISEEDKKKLCAK